MMDSQGNQGEPGDATGNGLHAKLFRSHLFVAAIGLVALAILLGVTLALRSTAIRLAEWRGPTARTSISTLEGVQKSLAGLRGWMGNSGRSELSHGRKISNHPTPGSKSSARIGLTLKTAGGWRESVHFSRS